MSIGGIGRWHKGCGGPGEPCDNQNRPYFRQNNNATRGQIAKIVYNAIGASAACPVPPL